MKRLSGAERLQLLKFVCSFVWADLRVHAAERAFVAKVMDRLDLSKVERKHVLEWLEVPPPPDEVDPTTVPMEHRKQFLATVEGAILADATVHPEERASLELFRQLLKERSSTLDGV
ncbi:MAG: TerB family tellurite resistance protein [Planctomycetota bacterium]